MYAPDRSWLAFRDGFMVGTYGPSHAYAKMHTGSSKIGRKGAVSTIHQGLGASLIISDRSVTNLLVLRRCAEDTPEKPEI